MAGSAAITFGSTGNTFGPSSSQQYPLVDPRCVREERERFRRDSFPELDRANSYYSMTGEWPDVGWLLIDRASYNKLSPYTNTNILVMCDFVNPPVIVTGLSIVQARCVTRGFASDPNAIYLLQVTNNQGVLYNPWFQYPINAQYNVVAPAYPGSTLNPATGPQYYSGSLTGTNNTDAWTWNGMVQDIWNKASALLGAYPGLPIIPNGAPENFIFVGVAQWTALSTVMDYLGLVVAGEFPNFTIVVLGAADAAFSALLAKYDHAMEDSMEYLDIGSGRVPSQVVVYFHRRNQVYGVEETVRYDAPQWQNVPAYSVTVPGPSRFSSAVGTAFQWSDFTVRYDQDGNPLAVDVTKAQAIANERAIEFYATIYRGTVGFMRNVYAGLLPFATGSMVDGVRWFNTGKYNASEDKWCGWRTEVVRGYAWEEVIFPLAGNGVVPR